MKRPGPFLAIIAGFTIAIPAVAQDHSMHGMEMNPPGTAAPASKKKATKPGLKSRRTEKSVTTGAAAKTAPSTPEAMPEMRGMDHGSMHDHTAMPGMTPPAGTETSEQGVQHSMPGMEHSMPGMQMPPGEHAGHDMQTTPATPTEGVAQTGTALPPGDTPAPPIPTDHAADRVFGPQAMEEARHHLHSMHGGQNFSQILFNLAEYQFRRGRDGYRWDGEAWFGGDINRLWLKSEGESASGEGVESAEIQALYSRAIGPYFNLQAGVRQDFRPSPRRTYATAGFEGLAPGFFEVEGAVFLSNKGDLLGRIEGYYDQRITQRLILQPRAELNFSARE